MDIKCKYRLNLREFYLCLKSTELDSIAIMTNFIVYTFVYVTFIQIIMIIISQVLVFQLIIQQQELINTIGIILTSRRLPQSINPMPNIIYDTPNPLTQITHSTFYVTPTATS